MPKNGYGTPESGGNWAGKALSDGEYVVSKKLSPGNGAWKVPNDHSRTVLNTKIPNGRMFFVNIGDVLKGERRYSLSTPDERYYS